MEYQQESTGTKGNKRSRNSKTWKKFPVKINFYFTTVVILFVLILTKVIMSTFFLNILPFSASSSDVALAQEVTQNKDDNLEKRELLVKKREKELAEKEASLKKLEQHLLPLKEEVDTSIEELNALQTSLTAYSKKLTEREKALEDTKITHLVKLYSAMDAGKAAQIMDKLQIETTVRILGNMKGKSAGQIMAMMPPEKGATISERLSKSK